MEMLCFGLGMLCGLAAAAFGVRRAEPVREREQAELPELTPEECRQLENLFSYNGAGRKQ